MALKKIGFTLLGLIVFVSTYLRSYINGDDVVHFSKMENKIWYFPNLEKSWIPNRVFDQFFRTLDVNLFDFFYFFQSSFLGISFFEFFKIYTGIIYSTFIICALLYLLSTEFNCRANLQKKPFSIAIFYIGLLVIFPWVNHTHFFAYQLPSFLCFIFFQKLSTLGGNNPAKFISFILLGFFCAFTLEAYTATILIILIGHLYCLKDLKCRTPLIITIGFNIFALAIMFKFSQRSAIPGFDIRNAFAMMEMLALSHGFQFIVFVLLFSCLLFRLLGLYSNILVGIIACSIFVNILISIISGTNYFSFAIYPWASTLNIAFLSLLFMLPQLFAKLKNIYLKSSVALLLMIISSGLINNFLIQSINASMYSSQLKVFYKDASNKKKVNFYQDSYRLNPSAFVMQVRPLPTIDSPEWFVNSYDVIFKKYVQSTYHE